MFQKIQMGLVNQKLDRQKKQYLKEKKRLEMAATEAAFKKKRLSEETEGIRAEKNRLCLLSDKELMVELILSIRGLHSRITDIETQQEFYESELERIKTRISEIENQVSSIESNKNSDTFI